MTDHEPFEILCTLAATRQLTTLEQAQFDEHRLHCSACCNQLHELTSIGLRLQFEPAAHSPSNSMPAGSLERFRARAVREGIAPHPVPDRRSSSYALASAAAIFVMAALLVFLPHGRKAAESLAITAAPVPTRPGSSESFKGTSLISRPSKPVHPSLVRHGHLPHTDLGVKDARLADQRFLRAIPPNYPFFGAQSTTTSARTDYPALSQSQMSRLDLFRNLKDAASRNAPGIAQPRSPMDIASTENVFDFAANIRQLHFQLSTAQ